MSDVRALLRAKRQEARITHPFAQYNSQGQLRCIICGILVKHASAWEGHLGSKAHRTNVTRLKEEERLREEARSKEEEMAVGREEEQIQESVGLPKKRKVEEEGSHETKKLRTTDSNGFPADFFSDPSHGPVLVNGSDDEDEEAGASKPAAPTQAPSTIDLEYERFQQELLQAPDAHETYERATVVAEPNLAVGATSGFLGQPSGEDIVEKEPDLTEEEKRRQKEIEEKEEIMDRLLEEERAQEEVDMKVIQLKNKLETFKKRREAARLAKKASW